MIDRSFNNQGGAAISGISGFALKVIAVITMLIDHTAATILERAIYGGYANSFVNSQNMEFWQTVYMDMRIIGRMAFPIYCFLLVEGFMYTRNRWKYAFRLFVFSLISEVPFDLAFRQSWWDMYYNNVFFTLGIGLLAIMAIDRMQKKLPLIEASRSSLKISGIVALRAVLRLGITGIAMAVAEFVFHTDYGASGVLAIVIMYVLYEKRILGFILAIVCLGCISSSLEFAALLMAFPLARYNGTRGKNIKYFFYVFYPAHLSILVGICYLLGYR